MREFYIMQVDASDDDERPLNETLASDQIILYSVKVARFYLYYYWDR